MPHFSEHARQAERDLLRELLSFGGHFKAISKVNVKNLQNKCEEAKLKMVFKEMAISTFPVYL
jgi:hypothetical protein